MSKLLWADILRPFKNWRRVREGIRRDRARFEGHLKSLQKKQRRVSWVRGWQRAVDGGKGD